MGPILIQKLSQLLVEFSYHTSGSTKQGIQALMAKEKNSTDTTSHSSAASSMTAAAQQQPSTTVVTSDSLKGVLHRTSNGVYYDVLQVISVPDFLDYNRIVCSLCTVMEQVYKKFLEEEEWFIPYKGGNSKNSSAGSSSSSSSSGQSTSSLLIQAIQDIDAGFKHNFFGLLSRIITELALQKLKTETSNMSSLMKSIREDVMPPLYSYKETDEADSEALQNAETNSKESSASAGHSNGTKV